MSEEMQGLSPMMRQYLDIKNKHKDHIVFYRLGDFYEMFFDDALLASKELELTLTGRDCGLPERAPMCGVPHHSSETYIARLIKKGYKVAICEQMESPAAAKGVVRREVVRIVTPGTLIESNLLDEGSNNYICCIYSSDNGYGLAFADISTGVVHLTETPKGGDQRLINELGRFLPSEIIFNSHFFDKERVAKFIKTRLACTADVAPDEAFEHPEALRLCLAHFQAEAAEQLGLEDKPLAVSAVGGLLDYLGETQRNGLERLMTLDFYNDTQFMHLDITARRNLEITETMRSREKRGSLLWVLDKTKTAMGKRLLKSWVEQPLINPAAINKRLNAVEELTENTLLRSELTEELSGIFDMERLLTRIVYGNTSPRDVKSLGFTLQKLPRLKDLLSTAACQNLCEVYADIDPLHDLCSLIEQAVVDEPPLAVKDGGVIRPGYDEELDQLRSLTGDIKGVIASIEQQERERTGIKTLKIGYNKVFGYYIEITKSYLEQVPLEYIRKQTLTGAERYITQQLKELEERVLTAHQQMIELECALFEEVRRRVSAGLGRIQGTAAAIARLDVFCSLAQVAVQNSYCRPVVDLSDEITITDGRHPVVEQVIDGLPFVPNDVALDNRERQIAVITGPNMAGKSTYMRQVALITLMAQMGSFVPAKSAAIGVVDGIYTRVGASDDLAAGQSTFMVEMSEVAAILRGATAKSLLILDEIGRGTSTFDGMSIARAVLEYIADKRKLGAKTLFATHYHELTALENTIGCVKNYNIAVKKRGDDIIFLRRIVPGGADDSYGIEVSKLAGIPDWIIRRAHQVLEGLEQGSEIAQPKIRTAAPQAESQLQMSLTDPRGELVLDRLRGVDANTVTAIEALNLLFELKKILQE